jgi:hypothetical protein
VLPGTTVQACAGWVHFETPADAVAESGAAVIGEVVERDRTYRAMEYDHRVWTVDVEKWVRGDGPERIRVASLADTCAASGPYGEGDPLESAGDSRVLLILRPIEGSLFSTPTPFQGVIVDPATDGIPEAWPPA